MVTMHFGALCQIDHDTRRVDEFDRIVRAGPWQLATFDGLLARRDAPLAAVLVHDQGDLISRAAAQIGHEKSDMVIVAYRETVSTEAIVDALQQGAVDYLAWPLDAKTLPERLQLAVAKSLRRRRNPRQAQVDTRGLERLSPREAQVLTQVASGSSTKEIAARLGISPRTVEIHRANMMDKLGVKSSVAAAVLAVSAGMISELPD